MINSDDTTHKIDNIVVFKYGIFVIETKNYSGLIMGDDMKYEDGHIVTDYHKHASTDQSLRGINKIAR